MTKLKKDFLWDKKRPRINIKKMWSPRSIGGMALPNVRLYNLSFEMSRLAKHWVRTDSELSWIKIEQELTNPYKPLDVLSHGPTSDGQDYLSNPVLAHSKTVWREVHRMCGTSHLRQSYASLWHNPAIRVGKKTVHWNQWLMKGICNVGDLYSGRVFISFSELKQKYNLEDKGNFWKFLQIRDSITRGQFPQDKNPVVAFLEQPDTTHRAAVFYRIFNGLKENICQNL